MRRAGGGSAIKSTLTAMGHMICIQRCMYDKGKLQMHVDVYYIVYMYTHISIYTIYIFIYTNIYTHASAATVKTIEHPAFWL